MYFPRQSPYRGRSWRSCRSRGQSLKSQLIALVGILSLACSLPASFSFTFSRIPTAISQRSHVVVRAWGDGKDDATIEEESRLKILESRRWQVRGMLKAAESSRNYRLDNGLVPELDENGKPIKSDGKFAVTATAFVVAAGAIVLRIGGRAALVSTLGLDFITQNPELQDQMNQVLAMSDSMDIFLKLGAFCLAWTGVKVLCFDAAGVVLALASGILFGGVLQGAVVSAFGATVGSTVAFSLAKMDTPVRKKALEIVDSNPSLRGIEKVVAKDGLKAILTLRLAPVLPIPLGAYNYVYGVTNVPYLDFAGGIFLGSLKPYLLDSYLGYFGKQLVDGTAAQEGGLQDVILLVALGFSVLIGVFASQLASETWDSVLEEQEAEVKRDKNETEADDGITREIFGFNLPQWIVGFQLALKEADSRVNELILEEFDAKVWNYTKSDGDNPIPASLDPAKYPRSAEVVGAYKGIDFAASLCDGLVLCPCMFSAYLDISDPLFDEKSFKERLSQSKDILANGSLEATDYSPSVPASSTRAILIDRLDSIKEIAEDQLEILRRRATKDMWKS